MQRLIIKTIFEEGDILMDGGNTFFQDTIRRNKELEQQAFTSSVLVFQVEKKELLKDLLLCQVDKKKRMNLVAPILTAISAKVEDDACVTYIGPNGAGHYVKMVHNGIEYGDMQLICEAYFILKNVLGLSAEEFHEVFQSGIKAN